MDTNIQIIYRNLPSEIIDNFQTISNNSDLIISSIENKEEFYNLTGGPADIEIFINSHLTELIASGLIFPTVYDLLKDSIKTTWKKLTNYYKKKNIQIEEDKNYISLNFKIKPDKTIEYNLVGKLDEQIIDKLNEKIFEYLQNTEKQNEDFANPDLKNKDETEPTIKMYYNSSSTSWLPYDYTVAKMRDEQLKQIINRMLD